MRRAAVIVALSVAACAPPAPTATEYRDLVVDRAAAFVEEAEQIRSIHLSELEQAIDDLVRRVDTDALEAEAIDETAARSAMLFAAIGDAVHRYALDLDEIEVPERLVPAHEEYVTSLRLSISGLGTTIEALTAASSFDEIDAAIGGSTLNDTQHRVDAACVGLERALDEAGASANLHCRED